MPDTENKQGNLNKVSMFRSVLEAVMVAGLIWTGSTLVAVRTDNAVMQNQLTTVIANTADFPAYKIKVAENSLRISALEVEVKDLRSVRNMR
jgi:hypothetical protein